MPGPLHGYRVVDLTSMISWPSATMPLAEAGLSEAAIGALAPETA